MKKGFSLIELLAVIVILAIIATIATPIVLDIIEDTKKSAVKRSSELYIKEVELSIAKASMDNIDITTCKVEDKNLKCGEKEYKIEVQGEYPKEVEIKATKEGKVYTAIKTEGYCVVKREGESGYSYKKLVDEVNDYAKEEDDASCSLTPVYATNKNCFAFDESTGTITDYYEKKDGCSDQEVIPIKINNVEVKILGNKSFQNKKLISVIIPKGVTTIKDYAFSGNQITNLDLPDSINLIGQYAFNSNPISTLKLPNGFLL